VAASATPNGPWHEARLESEIRVPKGGWLAARCSGSVCLPACFLAQLVYAHTSPVYVRVKGQPAPVDPAMVRLLLDHLDTSLQWVQTDGRFENDAQRARLIGIFHEARLILERKLSP
jgi:hypothetical protein